MSGFATFLNKWGSSARNLSLLLGIGGTALQSACYVVPAGHKAVIWDRFSGIQPQSKREGLNFRVPFVQTYFLYETRTRQAKIATETGTADLQTVTINIRLLYRPDPEKVSTIHGKYGPNYDDKILPSIGNEVLKSVIARFPADDLINSRDIVSSEISQALRKKARQFDIVLEDASLIHIEFSPEYSKAVELKVIARQESERYFYLVKVAEEERRANVIRAEGETEAAKLIMQAMSQGEGYLELKKIETAKELAHLFANHRKVTYLPKDGNVLLNLKEQL